MTLADLFEFESRVDDLLLPWNSSIVCCRACRRLPAEGRGFSYYEIDG